MTDQLLETDALRHPPRGARARQREDAILDATLELLLEVGYDNMSIDAVAERAHAGKATIYRHFADKAALVAGAIARNAPQELDPPDTGSLRGDLLAFGRCAAGADGLDGGLFAALLNASRSDELLAALMNERMWESKQRALGLVVERAVARGELEDSSRAALVGEVCCALVLHHLYVERAELDGAFRRHLVDEVAIPLLTYRSSETTPPHRKTAAPPRVRRPDTPRRKR